MGTGSWKDSSTGRWKLASISLRNDSVPHIILRKQIRRRGKHRADRKGAEARTNATGIGAAVTDSDEICAPRGALLAEHVHLVRQIADHLFRRRTYVNLDDLIDAGMVGLDEAMRGYEHESVEDFEAFASIFIRRAMLEFVRKANWNPARP
jgi:DNA-directed RNA polymerase sigma subunit (sigma70/sigma32)